MHNKLPIGLLVLLALASCQPQLLNLTSPTGTLAIAVENSSMRSVLAPVMTPTCYRLTASGPVGSTAVTPQLSADGSFTLTGLEYGNWSITIKGYTSTPGTWGVGDIDFLTGSTTIAVNTPSMPLTTIALSPSAGNGSLAMSLGWPATNTVDNVTATLTPYPTGSVITLDSTQFNIVNNPAFKATLISPRSLAAGTYMMSLRAQNNGVTVAASQMETLVIYNGQTSTWGASIVDGQIKSSAKLITGFSLVSGVNNSVSTNIDNLLGTISVTMPYGSSMALVTPTITASAGATVSPTTGTATSAYQADNSEAYTVTAADGSTKNYTVNVGFTQNPGKDIATFTVPNSTGTTISADGGTTGTIVVTVPLGTNLASLTPTITMNSANPSATVNPQSGDAQDFTGSVNYTVTAADSTTKAYVVTVKYPDPIAEVVAMAFGNKVYAFKFDLTAKTSSHANTFTTPSSENYSRVLFDPTGSYALLTDTAFRPLPLQVAKSSGVGSLSPYADNSVFSGINFTDPEFFSTDGKRMFTWSFAGSQNHLDLYTTSTSAKWLPKANFSSEPMAAGFSAMTMSPSGKFVIGAYSGYDGSINASGSQGYVRVFNVAPSDNSLSQLNNDNRQMFITPFAEGPRYLAVDPKERFVYAMNQTPRKLNVYTLASSGAFAINNDSTHVLTIGNDAVAGPPAVAADTIPISYVQSPLSSNPMIVNPNGKSLHIAASNMQTFYIYSYSVSATGVDPSSMSTLNLSDRVPFSLTFDKAGTSAYLVTLANALTSWRLEKYSVGSGGNLTSGQTVFEVPTNRYTQPVVDATGAYAFMIHTDNAYLAQYVECYDTTTSTSGVGTPLHSLDIFSMSVSAFGVGNFPKLSVSEIYP